MDRENVVLDFDTKKLINCINGINDNIIEEWGIKNDIRLYWFKLFVKKW